LTKNTHPQRSYKTKCPPFNNFQRYKSLCKKLLMVE